MSRGRFRIRLGAEAYAVVAVFVFSALAGLLYMSTFDGQAYFAQHMFGPAVMWAYGHGFENPMLSEAPAVEEFLYSERECVLPSDIPAGISVASWEEDAVTAADWALYHPRQGSPGWRNCQRFHLYLLGSAAVLWRVLGVAWSSLLPLYMLLFGITGAAAYGLFRLVMRRGLAVFFAILFVVAPMHIQQLPDLRDYAKAPFFLTAMFFLGYLAKTRLTPRRFGATCAACGVMLGIGVGFRQDLLICLPPFLIVALFLAPGHPWREKSKRLAGVGLFLLCFLILGSPILGVLFFQANNSTHDTLIGFNRYCNDRLGTASPVYDFGDPFLDEYTRAVIESYNVRIHSGHDRLLHYTREYDKAGAGYFREIIKKFPADLTVRAYASVLRVVDEMRPDSRAPWPRDVDNSVARIFYRGYDALTQPLLSHGRYAMALALVLLAGYNLKLGLAALFLLAWFAGYPSLRFSVRHCFHLQIVSYIAAGFLLQRGVDLIRVLRSGEGREQLRALAGNPAAVWRRYGRNAAAFVAIGAAAIVLPLAGLRVYQEFRVWEMLRTVANAPLQPLDTREFQTEDDRVLVRPLGFAQFDPDGPATQTEYLVVKLTEGVLESVPLTFKYESEDPERDFTRTVTVDFRTTDGTEPVRVYFPVYYSDKSRFAGVVVPQEQAELLAYYRAEDFEHLPVLLTATMYPDWQDLPLHFELTR